MTHSALEMFLARLAQLGALRTFAETFCATAQLGRRTSLHLNLALEELFTNTVRHGHRGDCDAPVWIGLSAHDRGAGILYEDSAPPFNPYARLPGISTPENDNERWKVGGLGVLLTHELAAARDYSYVFGRNRITLTFGEPGSA